MTTQHPLRIFLSYTRADRKMVEKVHEILEQLGHIPVWDRNIRPGHRFTEQIKEDIATSHLFMPIITERSQDRAWVHQETGYAIGVNVPILPLALESVPGELIAEIQALPLREDCSNLEEQLRSVDWERSVLKRPKRPFVASQVADLAEERTQLLVTYARQLADEGRLEHVRQRAFFSSFSIPLDDPHDARWDVFEHGQQRTIEHRAQLRQERITLTDHVMRSGCSLILTPFTDFVPAVHIIQLTELISFLERLPDDKADIVFADNMERGSVTLVGDWIEARAVIPRPGRDYEQTVFFGHGPTVLRSMMAFDEQMDALLTQQRLHRGDTLQAALEKLRQRLGDLST